MVPMLQHLSIRSQNAILNLRRISGQPSCPRPHVMTIDSGSLDNAASWLAAGYFAEDLTSFAQATGFSSDGYVETTLFVEANWRRRGFGTLLLEATMDWASLRQATGLRLICARTDWPMRHFAEKFG